MNRSVKPEEVLVKDGVCHMCTTCCLTKVHIHQGKIVQIDLIDQTVIDTCLRWKAQLDFVYHPERLKYPLMRAGELEMELNMDFRY